MWLALAAVASAQVAILQIKVVEGEGVVHLPGVRNPRPLTVEISDETGRPVAGAAISFHLPEDGPGGAFANGLRTEIVISDLHGRASLHGLQANRIPGRFQLRILASKEQARAGIVSFQYVADPKPGAPTAVVRGPHHRKWIAIGIGVTGGAAAGLLASRHSAPTAATPPAAPPPTLTIGAPAITVGTP